MSDMPFINFNNILKNIKSQNAFTLIELTLCVLLTAILAYNVLPKMYNYVPFKQTLFTKGAYSTLFYAQNLAVGSGCHIAVFLTDTSITLNLRNNCINGNFGMNVQDPANTNNSYIKKTPKGINMSYSNFPIYFDQNGQARSIYNNNTINASITIIGDNSKNIINIQGSKGMIK